MKNQTIQKLYKFLKFIVIGIAFCVLMGQIINFVSLTFLNFSTRLKTTTEIEKNEEENFSKKISFQTIESVQLTTEITKKLDFKLIDTSVYLTAEGNFIQFSSPTQAFFITPQLVTEYYQVNSELKTRPKLFVNYKKKLVQKLNTNISKLNSSSQYVQAGLILTKNNLDIESSFYGSWNFTNAINSKFIVTGFFKPVTKNIKIRFVLAQDSSVVMDYPITK